MFGGDEATMVVDEESGCRAKEKRMGKSNLKLLCTDDKYIYYRRGLM